MCSPSRSRLWREASWRGRKTALPLPPQACRTFDPLPRLSLCSVPDPPSTTARSTPPYLSRLLREEVEPVTACRRRLKKTLPFRRQIYIEFYYHCFIALYDISRAAIRLDQFCFQKRVNVSFPLVLSPYLFFIMLLLILLGI